MSKVKKIELSFVCNEDWNKMKPVHSGRHCGSCQKTVVNFTSMSDAQLIAFYAQKENAHTCGQFRTGQLEYINKKLAQPTPNNKPSLYHSILATVLLSTAACSSQNTSQGEPEVIVDASANNDTHKRDTVETKEQQQATLKDHFEPRKITHVDSIKTTDSIPEKNQNFKSIVFSERIVRAPEIHNDRHLGGVPMITYEDDIITDLKVVQGAKKPSLTKRIGAKIRNLFRREK